MARLHLSLHVIIIHNIHTITVIQSSRYHHQDAPKNLYYSLIWDHVISKVMKIMKRKAFNSLSKKNRLLNRVHYFQGCGSGNLSRLILLTTSNDRVPCPVSQQLSGPSDIACAPTATTSSDTANSVATQPAMSMWSQISR